MEDANRVAARLGIGITVSALILEPIASIIVAVVLIAQNRGYDCSMSRCVRSK